MLEVKDIDKQVEELDTLKALVKVYGEIAATRMNRVRETVLFARKYLDELMQVFDEVRISYAQEMSELVKRKKGGPVTILSHNGKTVAAFLSANTRLYGSIVQKTFDTFMKDVKEGKSEATVVGKLGQALYAEVMGDAPLTYFDYPDSGVDREELMKIIRHLVQYEEIHIYYGEFKNVMIQEPNRFVVSAQIPMDKREGAKEIKYLFEPSLKDILVYFETEIFGTMFEQTMAESQLAKYASRLVAMDRAEQNITNRVKKMQMQKLHLVHREENRKQLNAMSGVLRRFR